VTDNASGLDLPRVGLGTMGIEDPDVVATALGMGYRHLDTAQIYDNEGVVGEGLARADVDREEVVVATKVWADNCAYEDTIETTLGSLDRLGLGVVDLLYVHRPYEPYSPEETLPAFDELVDRGRVRHVAVSNFTPAEVRAARDALAAPLAAHQVERHPLFPSGELVDLAADEDHWLVAYSPLVAGRAGEVPELVEVAEKHDTTPEAVALAWAVEPENAVAIPKASSRAHLEENLAAADLPLDAEDLARIDGIERTEELFPE